MFVGSNAVIFRSILSSETFHETTPDYICRKAKAYPRAPEISLSTKGSFFIKKSFPSIFKGFPYDIIQSKLIRNISFSKTEYIWPCLALTRVFLFSLEREDSSYNLFFALINLENIFIVTLFAWLKLLSMI